MQKVKQQINEVSSYLKETPRITLAETQTLLGVSESTARRVFSRMEELGKGIRVHGGLQVLSEPKTEYNYPNMEASNLPQKKRIANAAVKHLQNVNTLFLDSGSTVYQFSLSMVEHLKITDKKPTSVFTNSLKILQALAGSFDIQFLGGHYREYRQDCCGFLTEKALQGFHFDLCVLGGDGCDVQHGVSCTDMETARLGQLAIANSKHNMFLLDSSKFANTALVTYARIEEIEMIVTDNELDSSTAKRIRAKGPQLYII